MNRSHRKPIAAALTAALLGAGGGAGVYAALSSPSSRTVVRQVTVASSQPAANTATLSVNQVYRRAYRGVVEITVSSTQQSPYGVPQAQQGQGSGFVYDAQGHLVTNEHVVEGASSISVRLWNGATYPAQLVGSDASTDLAVLKLEAPSSVLHPLSIGDSSKLAVGDGVVAIGSPFGLEGTVTAGIVSALHRQMTSPNNYAIDDSIQTDAAINHGNSGGPLLNTQGQVIGVNAQIESDSGGNDGVGFAIPSSTVKAIASRLISSGKVQHAYLGVAIETVPATGTTPARVRIAQVNDGTPAAVAGLAAGDIVTSIDGKKVRSGNALRAAIDAKSPGDKLTLTYTRDGRSRSVQVILTSRPS